MVTNSRELRRALGEDNFTEVFSLDRFKNATTPIPVTEFELSESFGDYRCLHLMIQQDGGKILVPDELADRHDLLWLIDVTQVFAGDMGYPYVYLTIDTLFVEKGKTQRTPGWHVDCLQGDEVPVKKPSQLTFSWSDVLPMEYADQSFELPDYVNMSDHNIFDCLAQCVRPESIRQCEEGVLYGINTYCVHRSAVAEEAMPRTFIRVSYTHVPITNNKMTVNPLMDYNYEIHSTTGQIPDHLKFVNIGKRNYVDGKRSELL